MTKYNRITGKVFGENATATGDDPEIGQFGSAKNGSYNGTTDVATIQSLPAWSKGWIEAVSPEDNFPPLPEMTGAMKVLSQQQCYLLQQGLAEWDSGTIYYANNFASKNGRIYISQTDENQGNDPSTDTTNWKEFASGGLPIGTIYPVACTAGYVPDGALPCNGTEYTKAQFTELWNNFLTATTPLLNTCTYTEYANDISTYGQCAKFAIDTANNTFKTPTIKNGAYITQAMSDGELGKSYNESLPNIKGDFGWTKGIEAPYGHGVFNSKTSSETFAGHTNATIANARGKFTFDASRSSSTYQDNAPVQGNNVRMRYFVQVANGQINQSQMDWSQWASSLQGKADVDTPSIQAPYIKDTYINETSGYNIWSNGYCEQWGTADKGSYTQYGTIVVNFLKVFKDTNYNSLDTVTDYTNRDSHRGMITTIHSKNTSTMSVAWYGINNTTLARYISWKVSGYLAEGEY